VFELRAENEATQHGTFHDYDRRVPLLLRGNSIRPGRFRTAATPADIAPTLAHLAGVALPKADGRVLREALR
jgi:arylsulfatase A-like enzyme